MANVTANQPASKVFDGTALTLGIIGLVFALLLPLVTYCTSIYGLVKSSRLKFVAGIVINIIALSLAVINSTLGVIEYLS